jgi:hypothetical protein
MSQTQQTSSVSKEIEKPFTLIDQEEMADNWFKSILLFAIVGLVIFGSFVLL